MKKSKQFVVPMLIAAFLCLAATSSYAQAPQIVAAGSSGAFVSAVASMVLGDTIQGFATASGVCGKNVWTFANDSTHVGFIEAVDPRSGTIPNEPGTIAVVWDNSASPTIVCVYLSIDSIVGDRLLLAQSGSGGTAGNGFLQLNGGVSGTPGGTTGVSGENKIAFIQDTADPNNCGPSSNAACGLPAAVYALVNNAHINVAFSDIRAEDARFAYGRAACSPADEVSCFGYGPLGGVGTAILSSFNVNNVANPIGFSISGSNDPFNTGLTVPATTTLNLGAYPVMFFYNAADTTAGGLGNASLLPKNIQSHVVTGLLSGQLGFNQDIMGVTTSPLKVVDVVEREPISGTYNTTEWQTVHDRDGNTGFSQETGFTPTSLGTNCFVVPSTPTYADPGTNCSNPMRVPGLENNHRFRAIGTGEMVAAVNATPNGNNRFGYAFYSLSTFASSKAGNTRYMTLDGVDPIFPTYSNGVFPNCTGFFNAAPAFSCTVNPSFDGVKSGNYRVWNIIRAIRYATCTGAPAPTCYTAPSTGPSIDALVAAAQDQAFAATAADFVPFQHCTAGGSGSCTTFAPILANFRSHYAISGLTVGNASNGNGTEPAENGGDMAGAIFPIVSDVALFNVTGISFITWIQ